MNNERAALLREHASTLRESFDRLFGAPVRKPPAKLEDLLAIRLGGNPYALRIDELSGLLVDQSITALPSPDCPALLGLVGVRGSLVAVYDLAALLGAVETGVPRWVVLAAGPEAVAFAFHDLDGHVRVLARSLGAAPRTAGEHPFVKHVVPISGPARTVISVPDLLTAIRPLDTEIDDTGTDDAGKGRP